ncbi:MAG: AAA family ATPase [Gemmatimonadota bacterium]|nr:AAA family ATPase [Gemmatimonadota bacterium]
MNTGTAVDPAAEFRRAMAEQGLSTPDPIIADGKLRRVRVAGEKQRNGWYVLHGDGRPAGRFGCWKRGLTATWSAEGDASATTADRAEWERIRRAREAREKELHERTARKAERIWSTASPADPDHPYFRRKQIRPHGIRQSGTRLIVPVRDGSGALCGLQFISADGGKKFLTGTAKRGHYHSFGKPNGALTISEGLATAATTYEATGIASVVAFDAGNLAPVATTLRGKFPDARIIIASDNDRTEGNPGLSAATKAARAAGALVAVPHFSEGEQGTDWNDFGALHGLDAVAAGLRQASTPGGRLKMLSLSDLEKLRDPEWLADTQIPAGGLVVTYGPPGAGKTFWVLGLVLSVAYGIPFYGSAVKRGSVLYIAAEGHAGLKARVRAWKTANAVSGDAPAFFYPDVVNLLDVGAINDLVTALKSLPEMPLLVVFDTFARCIPGGNENDARDVGLAISHADRIRKETGAAVLLVHHTSKAGEVERGSTALRGAADTMLQLRADDGVITVTCDKQKEAEPFARLALRLQPIADSCVLITDTGRGAQSGGAVTNSERDALETLTSIYLGDGVSTSVWLSASKMQERSFYRAVKPLVERGFVTQERVGRTVLNSPTLRGQAAITDNCQSTDKPLPDSRESITDTTAHAFRSGSPVSDADRVEELGRAAGWEEF